MDDTGLIKVFTDPIKKCAKYKPVFGTKSKTGVSLAQFRSLYGADPLYSWIGLDSDFVYAAHKASGGITSFYRQLGIGCERLVREIIKSSLNLNEHEVNWSYETINSQGKKARLSLDARIDETHLKDPTRAAVVKKWCADCLVPFKITRTGIKGAVFEVRQGYKSADSKRQNADLRNAVRAYNDGYIPVVMVMSNQLNDSIKRRYTSSQIVILSGTMSTKTGNCTYAFFKDIVGFDLEKFFVVNKTAIRTEIEGILQKLVKP